ncbi:MAG: hypothetical protein WEC34_03050 [Acidimicrobiia bacterium]
MRGNIREKIRGKSYELRIALGKNPATGKYRQRSVTISGTRRDAERLLRRMLVDLGDGTPIQSGPKTQPESETVTFAEFLAEWMRYKRASELSPTTIDRYDRAIALHLVPTLGDVPIGDLIAKDFDDLYLILRQRLKPATVLKSHLVARAALDRAVRWGWLDENAAARAEAPSTRLGQRAERVEALGACAHLIRVERLRAYLDRFEHRIRPRGTIDLGNVTEQTAGRWHPSKVSRREHERWAVTGYVNAS